MSGSAENQVDNFSVETNEEEKSCERRICKQVNKKDAQSYLNQSSVLSNQYSKGRRGDNDERDDIKSNFSIGIDKHESDDDGDGKTYLRNNHAEKSDVYARYLCKSDDKWKSESESYISNEGDENLEIVKSCLDKSGENQEIGKSDDETGVMDKCDENQEIGKSDEIVKSCLDNRSDKETREMDKRYKSGQICLYKSCENQEREMEKRVLDKSGENQKIGKSVESGNFFLDNKSDEKTRVMNKSEQICLNKSVENQEIVKSDESDDDESFLSCRSNSECSYYRFSTEF